MEMMWKEHIKYNCVYFWQERDGMKIGMWKDFNF